MAEHRQARIPASEPAGGRTRTAVTAMGDPYIREIGRITDSRDCIVIVGVKYGAVTLRTLHTRTSGAAELGEPEHEELAQLLAAAAWQAARDSAALTAAADSAGEDAGHPCGETGCRCVIDGAHCHGDADGPDGLCSPCRSEGHGEASASLKAGAP